MSSVKKPFAFEEFELAPLGHVHGFPADSEIPPAAAPPRELNEVTPHPCEAGGVANVPEDVPSRSRRHGDELDHAGADVELPQANQERRDA
jgi:hypothetical protein